MKACHEQTDISQVGVVDIVLEDLLKHTRRHPRGRAFMVHVFGRALTSQDWQKLHCDVRKVRLPRNVANYQPAAGAGVIAASDA